LEDVNISGMEDAPADIESIRKDRDDLRDRLLRTAAEFDNYRKRVERERRELTEFAAADLIRDLLPIVDDLERALATPGWSPDDPTRRGVDLIHRRFIDVLKKRGVETLDTVGQDFNPEWHESVGTDEGRGRRAGEITAEVRRGYRLGGRLLRAAMVKVAAS
jgi:molecular chaperone GrpE